jgi:hypothetical protein
MKMKPSRNIIPPPPAPGKRQTETVLHQDSALPDAPLASTIHVSDVGLVPPEDLGPTDADREKAYHTIHAWHGLPLQPFSLSREALFHSVRLMLPISPEVMPKDYHPSYLNEAILILFLCTSTAARLASVRHNYEAVLNAAAEWGDEHIHRSQADEAGRLAFRLLHESEITTAIPQPSGKGASATAGN